VEDLGVGGGGPRQRPEAALAVADRGVGDERQQAGEQAVAEPPVGQHAPDLAGEAGPDHVVGPPLQDRRDQPLQLAGVVLAVGVAEGHRDRSAAHGGLQAAADGGAEALVAGRAEHQRAGLLGQLGGAVAGAVVDHQAADGVAADPFGHPADHRRHRRLLVVGRQEQHHRPGAGGRAGAGRGGPGGQAEAGWHGRLQGLAHAGGHG